MTLNFYLFGRCAIDPLTGLTIAKTASDLMKKVYDVAKNQTDHEMKLKLDEVLDALRDLKQQASELEDENRDLREKLRFKGEDFDFKNPYWFDKQHPERALCPKCFAQKIYAPMGERYGTDGGWYRRCLNCLSVQEEGQPHTQSPFGYDPYKGGPDGWMR